LPTSGLVDFTHPDAYAFWRDSHRRLFDEGVAVMKTDFGEQVPAYALAHNGDSGERLHNAYPLLYNQCVFEAAQRYSPHGALVFARSGWAGSQRYPTQWGGDPQSDWGALAASIRGMLSWANSGVGGYATDIGGFYGEQPSAELFVRWTQAAVFGPHMRFHGIGAREPWSFGEATLALIRDALKLRYQLVPYIEQAWTESTQTGLPICRAMALAFPGEPESWSFERQYMFGPDLLVAPITRPGGETLIWLPRGRWHDFQSGEIFAGGCCLQRRYALYEFPIFARHGAQIGLAPVVQKTDDWTVPTPIETVRSFG
ncbi:MAG: TIM-barrel domain-containing protein, partial [Pseudomonadota bacterium]